LRVEKDYYEKYWRLEEQAPPQHDPLTEERVRLFLMATAGQRLVLDVGCGNAREMALLKENGKTVVGLDIAYNALRWAKGNDPKGAFLQAACDGPLPFSDERFDGVYCAEVIEHLLNPEVLVSECYRVLKPSGAMFVTTPYHGLLKNLAIATMGFDSHFDVAGPHIRFFSRKSLCGLLAGRGFQVEKVWRFGRHWPVWMNMAVLASKGLRR